MRKRFLVAIGLIILVLVLDQWLKIWIKTTFVMGEERSLIGNIGFLHFTENNGIAFGMELPGTLGKLLLTVFRIIAAVFIFAYLSRLIKKGVHQGIIYSGALIFAGAVGNIFDSLVYGKFFTESTYDTIAKYDPGNGYSDFFHGKVVDMLYFPILKGNYPSWVPGVGGQYFEFFQPIFNIADSSITIGILLIIIFFRRHLREL
ncbi:MAG: lipoprotein signal peptidase [Sphingobacteriales bacterium]|nr:MAG: lipoprotein signal peptidase [Sphingobacteriales bacterium]